MCTVIPPKALRTNLNESVTYGSCSSVTLPAEISFWALRVGSETKASSPNQMVCSCFLHPAIHVRTLSEYTLNVYSLQRIPAHAFPLTPSSYIPRPNAKTDYLVDTPEPRALLQRTFLGHHPLETIHSPYISPASPRVLRAYGHPVTLPSGTIDGAHLGVAAVAPVGASALAVGGPVIDGSLALCTSSLFHLSRIFILTLWIQLRWEGFTQPKTPPCRP